MITEQKRPASTEKLHHVAIEAVRQAWHVVVQQQTDVDTAHAQVRSELHSMDWRDRADGFDFQDKLARDNNIRLEAVADFRALIEDGNCDLPGEGNACVCQFSAQAQRIPTVRGRYVGAPRSPTLLLDQRFRKKHNALSVSTVLSALPPCGKTWPRFASDMAGGCRAKAAACWSNHTQAAALWSPPAWHVA